MKKTITSLMLVAGTMLTLNAQVLLQENFTNPFNPATNGWVITNNSAPTSTVNWFQGNPQAFPAFNGGPSDYVGANFNSTSGTAPGTISNWLITPSLTIQNGAVLEFATRTTTNPAGFPDRLEVYLSTAGNGSNVGSTATSLGTFSTLLVAVNPSLTSTGYPGVWTVYSVTLSGIPSPTVGRVGFRYHVTNAGPSTSATNSDYIGLDAVKFSVPCNVVLPSYTICAGGSATITATGASAGATFTWSPNTSNASSVIVSPGSTTTYTLDYEEGGSPCPSVTSTVTIGSQLSVSVSASSQTICAGGTVTLTANSSATTYSWSTGAAAQTTTVAPTTSTTYSVGALSGFCFGGNTINITVLPTPTVSFALSPTLSCIGTDYTLTASGAADYLWLTTPTSGFTNNPLTLTPSAPGARSYTLVGLGANGCLDATLVNFTVNPTPTVTASASKTLICINSAITLSATGASSYVWTGAGVSTTGANSFSSSTAGSKTITVVGTNAEGCSSSAALTVSVTGCVGITTVDENALNGKIFPNPFSNEIKVNGIFGSVEVYSAIGQLVVSATVNGDETINTTSLSKGVYIVKGFNANGDLIKTSKLIKQ